MNYRFNDTVPLVLAAQIGCLEIFNFLLDHGSKIEAKVSVRAFVFQNGHLNLSISFEKSILSEQGLNSANRKQSSIYRKILNIILKILGKLRFRQ